MLDSRASPAGTAGSRRAASGPGTVGQGSVLAPRRHGMPESTTIAPKPPPARRPPSLDGDGTPKPPPPRPRVKKLRLALILVGLSGLALVSTLFGMLTAVASELPSLENEAQFRKARNSVLLADDKGETQVARLTGTKNRLLLGEDDVAANVKNAVIAVEDQRFYEHEGVDYRGIARAFLQDVRRQEVVQGGSTITQQFIKNALAAQGDRSVFQKLREAALAYHLEREWSKRKILTQYLNTVYFGNGAYGIESAVRTYFGERSRPGGGPRGFDPHQRAARDVAPHEAALLAGLIASPTAYDPVERPSAARERRDMVLRRMLEQRLLTRPEYEKAVRQAIPSAEDIRPPTPDSAEPYFSTWLTQQLIDRYGSARVFGGGLRIKTTLDPALQEAAEGAVEGSMGGLGPAASLVAVENKTGEVKALVGGDNFGKKPFNLATNGQRQPGSAFKPFTLVAALEQGIEPGRTYASRKKVFPVPGGGAEKFVVNNYEDQYSGTATLAEATAQSDNSVYAEVGLEVGTHRVARTAQRMGIRTRVSTNPAMTLGGLDEGVTPLEMALAYSTIANKGRRVSGSLAAYEMGPVAVEKVEDGGETLDENRRVSQRVFPESVGETTERLLAGVVNGGTGEAAKIDGEFVAGKTGTTENYGDAWFVGFNEQYTVAVWVGYPERLKYMKYEYGGEPVAGGTYPAEIWRAFMTAAIRIRDERHGPKAPPDMAPGAPQAPQSYAPAAPSYPSSGQASPSQTPQSPSAPSQSSGSSTQSGSGSGSAGAQGGSSPSTPPSSGSQGPTQRSTPPSSTTGQGTGGGSQRSGTR